MNDGMTDVRAGSLIAWSRYGPDLAGRSSIHYSSHKAFHLPNQP